jgi:hypothetical protein
MEESRLPNHMDTDAVIAYLNDLPDLFGAAHVTRFRCYREAPDGRAQRVIVEIYDEGLMVKQRDDVQEVEIRRYSCVARSDDGKVASGNSADKVSTVLSTLHWWDLD